MVVCGADAVLRTSVWPSERTHATNCEQCCSQHHSEKTHGHLVACDPDLTLTHEARSLNPSCKYMTFKPRSFLFFCIFLLVWMMSRSILRCEVQSILRPLSQLRTLLQVRQQRRIIVIGVVVNMMWMSVPVDVWRTPTTRSGPCAAPRWFPGPRMLSSAPSTLLQEEVSRHASLRFRFLPTCLFSGLQGFWSCLGGFQNKRSFFELFQ